VVKTEFHPKTQLEYLHVTLTAMGTIYILAKVQSEFHDIFGCCLLERKNILLPSRIFNGTCHIFQRGVWVPCGSEYQDYNTLECDEI
jgi:hypothetical protein